MIYPTEPINADLKGLNKAIIELNSSLDSLSWLNNKYGVAEILTSSSGKSSSKIRGISKGRYPAIYVGSKKENGYINLMPDSKLGNYSYILMDEDIGNEENEHRLFKGAMVFWWDYRRVYINHKEYNRFNVKDEIIEAIKGKVFKGITIRIGQIDYDPSKIYANLDKDVIENQFMMRPYGGMRINFDIAYIKTC